MNGEKPQKNKGFRRLIMACLYSYDGIKSALKNEAAFRQEAMLAAVLFAALPFLGASLAEKLLMGGAVVLLLIVELLNSAIEECVNLCTQDFHPLAKRAKDMASAAVLFAIFNLVAVWAFVLCKIFF